MVLEFVHIGIHAVGRGRTHGTARISFWSFSGTGVKDGMVLEVIGQILASVQAGFQLGVGDIACHDDSALQVYACAHGILAELLAHVVYAFVQVYLYALGPFAWLAVLLGYQLGGVVVHFLQPDAVRVDFRLDIAVCRAAHSQSDRTAGAMARQSDDAYVVGERLAAKLRSQSYLLRFHQEFVFQVDVAEGPASLVTRGGQVVVVFN